MMNKMKRKRIEKPTVAIASLTDTTYEWWGLPENVGSFSFWQVSYNNCSQRIALIMNEIYLALNIHTIHGVIHLTKTQSILLPSSLIIRSQLLIWSVFFY